MSKPTNEVIQRYKKKTYKQVNINLRKELVAEWETKLEQDGLSKSEFIRSAVTAYLGKTAPQSCE